jgi:hypothetical protein
LLFERLAHQFRGGRLVAPSWCETSIEPNGVLYDRGRKMIRQTELSSAMLPAKLKSATVPVTKVRVSEMTIRRDPTRPVAAGLLGDANKFGRRPLTLAARSTRCQRPLSGGLAGRRGGPARAPSWRQPRRGGLQLRKIGGA